MEDALHQEREQRVSGKSQMSELSRLHNIVRYIGVFIVFTCVKELLLLTAVNTHSW